MQGKQGKNNAFEGRLVNADSISRYNGSLKVARNQNSNGLYDIHTNVTQWPMNLQPTHARWEIESNGRDGYRELGEELGQKLTIFPKLDPVYARNFRIHDIYLESASESALGVPGVADEETSLDSVPNHILDELPPECRQAFQEARDREAKWKSGWNTEAVDGRRAHFLPATNWYP